MMMGSLVERCLAQSSRLVRRDSSKQTRTIAARHQFELRFSSMTLMEAMQKLLEAALSGI